MSKKEFIQQIVIRALPEISRLSATIQYAESLWEHLGQYGYGADKTVVHRENVDYYKALNDKQKAAFDKFWTAFKHKQGRDGAAMRWLQLGDVDDAEYQRIIAAAKQEAAKPVAPGQVRLMAQGWLSQRRYEDFTPDPVNTQKQQKLGLVHLKNELSNLKNLYALSPNEAIAAQIKILEEKISQLAQH